MDQVLKAWLNLVEDLDVLVKALDGGIDGLIHALGDYADEAVQALVPAYATAVAVCQQVKVEGVVDCEKERIKIRDLALREIVHALGLDPVIKAILDTYNAVPQVLKDIVLKGAQAASAAVDLFKDPSWQNLKEFSSALVGMVGSYFGPFISVAMAGLSGLESVGAWLADFGSDAASAVAALLSKAGGLLATVASDIVTSGIEVIGDAGHLVAGFISDGGSALGALASGAASAVEDLASGVADAASDAADATAEFAGDAIDAIIPSF